MGVEELCNQASRRNILRRPEPMKSDLSRRNHNKYCRFHGEVGHNTNDCMDLKDEIERLIREGRLQELWAERRNEGQREDNRRQYDGRHDNDHELVGIIWTIHGGPYIRGDSQRSQKNYAHKARHVYQQRFWNLSSTRLSKAPRISE